MTKVWLYSDPHLYHQNIIKYENRPFKNVEEMNEVLLSNYNSLVRKDDKVFWLGDVGIGNKEKIKNIVNKFNGNKILIMGNHDRKNIHWHYDCGFKEVYKYPIIYNQFYILSHKPVYISENMPYVNCYGHLHSKIVESDHNQYFNCCVENHNYKPILFTDVASMYTDKEEI
jgi:calcineurin-like phosphoesterase family protein